MRTKARAVWALVGVLALLPAGEAGAAEHRLGVGAHYWRAVEDLDLDEDIDESGLSGVLSYQYVPAGPFKLELDVEYFDKGFGGVAEEEAISPQAYLVLGEGLYAALGAGVLYSSELEDDFSDVFYAARLGLDFNLLPRFHLDVNANYRFDTWGELDEADTDTITLGAVVRLAF